MTIIHRFRSGGYIARNGAAVEVCVGPGVCGLPMIVVFEGDALAALAVAAQAAFRERSGEWKDVTDSPRPKKEPQYTIRRNKSEAAAARIGRAERDARRWKEKSGT